MVDKTREIALKILFDVFTKKAYSNISINKYFGKYDFEAKDRAFITEMVYGTIRWKLKIDWVIEKFSNIRFDKISHHTINILRLGTYQILFMDRVPDSAACNESVKLSKKYGHKGTYGFVNAVLRNISRNKSSIFFPNKNHEYSKFLSVYYSHPLWLVERWLDRYGSGFTEGLLKANNETPEFCIRTNTLKCQRDELRDILMNEGIKSKEGKYLSEAVIIENPSDITRLESFKKGLFQVQDESSMLVSRVLDPKPGETIIDVCSAPGGKTSHIVQLMNNCGTVLARDIYQHKINIVEKSLKRLGNNIVKTKIFNAEYADDKMSKKADRVIIDAPCTGYGVIKRKPEIKIMMDRNEKNKISKLQLNILKASSKLLKSGGVMVYSTCTFEPEENEMVVEKFLYNEKGFAYEGFYDLLPEGLKKEEAKKGFLKIYPHIDGIDGFFIAKLKKV